MSRSQNQSLEFNSFVKGLVTEAGPLTFPENASLDEENFDLNLKGYRSRRKGMDYEAGASLIDTAIDVVSEGTAIQSYLWKGVGNSSSVNIAVVQVGVDIYFFDANEATISGAALNSGAVFNLSTGGLATDLMSFATIYGKLIVSHASQELAILEYDDVADSISENTFRVESRDLWGVYESTDLQERPLVLAQEHNYNLQNQGWFKTVSGTSGINSMSTWTFSTGGFVIPSNPIVSFFNAAGRYPANADVITFFIETDGSGITAADVGAFNPHLYNRLTPRIEPPKGKFVVDIFNRAASRVLNGDKAMTGVPGYADQTQGSIGSIASYSGRVFYSVKETGKVGGDKNSPSLGSNIFFSRSADTEATLGKCYALNDPTGTDFFEPKDTDGGFINIPELGEVFAMEPMANSLFVFASNGVWEIHGGEQVFSATNQNVTKVSNSGAISRRAVTVAEGQVFYWGESGIYQITIDQVSQRGAAQDITQTTIKQIYSSIAVGAKAVAQGVYDQSASKIKWLYRDSTLDNTSFYNTELSLDIRLGAFSKNTIKTIATRTPYLAGVINLTSPLTSTSIEGLTVSGVSVVAATVPVVVSVDAPNESVSSSVKYLAFRQNSGDSNYSFTFSEYNESTFADWKTADGVGVDAAAFMLTGYQTGGESQRFKKARHITVHCERTEDGFVDDGNGGLTPTNTSSCKVQAQWEWVNDVAAGRWGTEFQAYRLNRPYVPADDTDDFSDFGFTVVSTRNKLRGKGRALSLLFSSEAANDLILYGWGLNISLLNRE